MKPFDPLDKIDYVQDTVVNEVLISDDERAIILFALDSGTEIPTHTSKTDACIFILEGDIEFTLEMNKINLSTGEMFMFKKDVPHSLAATKKTKLLLIKI